MKRFLTSVIACSGLFFGKAVAQPGMEYDLKKPTQFENRPLGYEKSDQTKFSHSRRFIQNTITHYNFFFNTNIKLTEVVNRAKAGFKDDFTNLLPFYNYSLETTARDKRNLDSVLDKVNTSILVRDLRNDWNDNMYMLMGQAYYYKNNLDSANILFQFVNYAYAPRDKDNYPIPIGSNYGQEEGQAALSISTNEHRSIVKRALSLPPSRNESFVWRIRTWLQHGDLTRAGVLIDILRHDPQFPERLQPALDEVQAFWFYQQSIYDSAATHLVAALGNATTQNERARWEFLAGQLFEASGQTAEARRYYEKSSGHTLDPVMDVYARLNAIRENKRTDKGDAYILKNITVLRRMARKELYAPYQDIIFYAAAEMEMERSDTAAAIRFLARSISAPGAQESTRNKAFLKLGWLYLDAKKYPLAKLAYDSVSTADPAIADSLLLLVDRKQALNRVVPEILIIERQDSLQRLAMMTESDRNAYIRKMLRAYRKQLGLSEDERDSTAGNAFRSNTANTDMFGNSDGTAEWYFNNPSLKSRGFNDFKSKWGSRPNVDNWWVQSLMNRSKQNNATAGAKTGNATDAGPAAAPALTAAALLKNIPLTPEAMKASQDSVETAMFALGKALQNNIPDYRTAIFWYDSLEARFPDSRFYQESLFDKYYCYRKLGDSVQTARALARLREKFPNGRYLGLIEHPPTGAPDRLVHDSANRSYEKIYDEMIAGHFKTAVQMKQQQDSIYGEKYWTPQLTYVEALYFMHQRNDSLAKARLNNIISRNGGTAMANKAKNTLRVLNDREKLEKYLSELHIERMKDDSMYVKDAAGQIIKVARKRDTAAAVKKPLDSLKKTGPDSLKKALGVDSSRAPARFDTATGKPRPAFVSAFAPEPAQPHAVALLMTQVDPVYVTETKNAFDRFNKENYYGKTYEINTVAISDTVKLVLIRGFADAADAITYLNKTGPRTGREIIPWLPATKYQFLIIDDHNLDILQANKDVTGYKKFLSYYFPGPFPADKK